MNIISVNLSFIFCIYNIAVCFSIKIGITRKFIFRQVYSSRSLFVIRMFESLLCKNRGKILFP